MKARFITTVLTLPALLAALALGSGVGADPAAAATMNPENSFLVCEKLRRVANLYYPTDSAPRYNVYAWRIDGGPWTYLVMYFSHGQEWQLVNGQWVATTTNHHNIWAPNDGRSHLVEVYEARSTDGKSWSPWILVLDPCYTESEWAPFGGYYSP
jgi:hypothetical protein